MQFSIVLLPFLILFKFVLPESILGEVLVVSIFLIFMIVCLLAMPECVGKEYKESIYPQVIIVVKKILKTEN